MVSLVVFNRFLALSPTLDAGSYPFVFQRFSELVSVMASILEQPFAFWQTSQQGPCPDVVADLYGGDEKVQCPPLAVSDGVQLSIHTVCDLANHMSTRPFLLPCCSVCLEIRCVDHHGLLFTVIGHQSSHHPGVFVFVALPLPSVVERCTVRIPCVYHANASHCD